MAIVTGCRWALPRASGAAQQCAKTPTTPQTVYGLTGETIIVPLCTAHAQELARRGTAVIYQEVANTPKATHTRKAR